MTYGQEKYFIYHRNSTGFYCGRRQFSERYHLYKYSFAYHWINGYYFDFPF